MLGHFLLQARRFAEAEEAFRQTIAIRDRVAPSLARTTYGLLKPQAQFHLGQVLEARQRPAEAEAAYGQAVMLAEPLAAQFPDVPAYRQALVGYSLQLAKRLARNGKSEQAAPYSRQALDLSEHLLAAPIPEGPREREEVISALNSLSSYLRDAGELRGAERAARKLLQIARQTSEASPADPAAQHKLAQVLVKLGTVLRGDRRLSRGNRPL
jgi:tetratricopeptide (TPR) repeat protein